MSDTIKNKYKILFSVNILHHYFLDNGRVVFLFDKTKKQPELSNYDVRQFLAIVPTASTSEKLKNLRAIYRATSMGFLVAVPEGVEVKDELVFMAIPTDPLFNNYTTLTLRGQKIETSTYEEGNETKYFRVKHNVFVLTNNAPKENLYLSSEIANKPDDYQVEEIFREADGNIYQATADEAAENAVKQLKEPLPNGFVSNADIPFKTLHGVNFRGIELTEEMRDDVFALLKIDAEKKHFEEESPAFEVHFKSRATYWRYFDKTEGKYKPENPDFWCPLTEKGKRTTKRKATPESIKVNRDNAGKILELISEINP